MEREWGHRQVVGGDVMPLDEDGSPEGGLFERQISLIVAPCIIVFVLFNEMIGAIEVL